MRKKKQIKQGDWGGRGVECPVDTVQCTIVGGKGL